MDRSKTLTRVVLITAAITVGALGIAALIGLATSGFRWGQIGRGGVTVDDTKTQALSGVDAISIDVVSDDVRIIEGTGDELVARLHGTAGARSEENLPKLTAERSGSTVVVGLSRHRIVGFGFYWSNLVLDISVPKGYAQKLSVKTVSGDINVADHGYAGLLVSTTSGDARVGAVTATAFHMRSTSGDLSADSVSSQQAEISSVSGDIRIKALTGDATLHTTSGTVNAAFTAVPGRVDASSTSGEVVLRFPANAQFQLNARSTSGDITCGFPVTITESANRGGRHALAGAVGTGSGQVAVRTTSGDIHIEK